MTRAQSLKRRYNMPSVGDSLIVLFPLKEKKRKEKKRKKTLLTGIYSLSSPSLITLLLLQLGARAASHFSTSPFQPFHLCLPSTSCSFPTYPKPLPTATSKGVRTMSSRH
jgi:hypothetical protein